MLTDAANSRWELDALDLLPDGKTVCLRLAGPASALEAISREVLARWPGQTLSAAEADAAWSELREFRWAHPGGALVKVAITPAAVPSLDCRRAFARWHAGFTSARVAMSPSFRCRPRFRQRALQERLRALALPGVSLCRQRAPLVGRARRPPLSSAAVKQALDPQNRFPLSRTNAPRNPTMRSSGRSASR